MKITKQRLIELVRVSIKKHMNEGLFDKDEDKQQEEGEDTVSGQPESPQVQAVEDKLEKVQGLDTLLDKVKTAAQATDLISGVINSLSSIEQQHVEQGLQKVLSNLKNNPDAMASEGTGGMSSASMGGPVLSEQQNDAEYRRGYSDALQQVADRLMEMQVKVQGYECASLFRNVSLQLSDEAAKVKGKSSKSPR